MIVFDVDLDFFFDKQIGPEATADLSHRTLWNKRINQWLSLDSFIEKFQPAFCPDMAYHCVENHRDVPGIWAAMIKKGSLKIPFTIIHFDAHSDLYVGRQKDDYFKSPTPADIEKEPALINTVAEEDNFLWWTIRLGWVNRILWVKPPCVPLYYLGEKEFSSRFQPDFAHKDIKEIENKLMAILSQEDVDHPILLSQANKKVYQALNDALLYAKYEAPFICHRFGKTFTFSLHRLDQLTIFKGAVTHLCLAHSEKYVPQKADKVFNDFKAGLNHEDKSLLKR